MQNLIFETDRLYVRRFTLDDEEDFHNLNLDQEVMHFIRQLKNREESRHFLEQNIESYKTSPMTGRWSVHEKGTDRFVGMFAVIPVDNSIYWQLGYALQKQDWGRGFATELTRTGISYTFRRMFVPKIMAITDVDNVKSQKVLLKAGFAQLPNAIEHGKESCQFELKNKAVIETDRLLIAALDNDLLDCYIQNDQRLENEIGLKPGNRQISVELRDMLEKQTVPAMRNATENNFYFHTIWIVIDKVRNMLVAEMGFQGVPNEKGEVEIGYGTQPGFEGEGIMTEAISGMLSWTSEQAGIRTVLAKTESSNPGSIKVLEKNGFKLIDQEGEILVWAI
ncbi:MAG: N-acetyltransferase [Chitinophagaceae bacterium]|nr:MAG: N-acetyltransferase [Chitinophagaceae bacterium]